MEIDRKLERYMEAEPDAVSDMVICCSTYDAGVRSALEKSGMKVRSGQSEDLDIVAVTGRLGDVARLAAIPQVLSVELDEEQRALD